MAARDARSIPGSGRCFAKLISFRIGILYFGKISQLGFESMFKLETRVI